MALKKRLQDDVKKKKEAAAKRRAKLRKLALVVGLARTRKKRAARRAA